MKKAVSGCIALGCLALLTSASVASAETLKTITVAVMAPRSGSLKGLGDEVYNGAFLALGQAKAEFRKMGFTLQLKAFDDTATPAVGEKLAQNVVNDKNILVLVGPINSGVTIPVSAVLAPAKLTVVTVSSNPKVTDRKLANVNRIGPRDDSQGPTAAQMIAGTLQSRSVFIVDDATLFGKGLNEQVTKAFKTTSIKVMGNVSTPEKKNFTTLLETIKTANPEAIYFGGNYDIAIPFIQQMHKMGMNIQVVGSDGFDVPEFISTLKDEAKGVMYTSVVAPPLSYPNSKVFMEGYRKMYKKEPGGYAVFGFDCMKTALQGLRDAVANNGGKLPSRADVMEATRKVQIEPRDLVTGGMAFNSIGDRTEATVFVLRVGEDGVARVNTAVKVKQP
jgi:branched-chain amino acid transport system substrate-binding protein